MTHGSPRPNRAGGDGRPDMSMTSKALLLAFLGTGLSVAAEAVDPGPAPGGRDAAAPALSSSPSPQPASATTQPAAGEAPARGGARLPPPDLRGNRGFQPTPEQVKAM